jgi:hypothetical protein
MHCAAANVYDQHHAVPSQTESITEGGSERLINETNPANAESMQDSLHFRAIGFKCGDWRSHHQIANPLSFLALDFYQQFPQESIRSGSRRHCPAAQSTYLTAGIDSQGGLECRNESRMY